MVNINVLTSLVFNSVANFKQSDEFKSTNKTVPLTFINTLLYAEYI